MDPDPDPTFVKYMDPDPTFAKIMDPDPDPTLAKNMDPDPDPTSAKIMDPDPDPDPTFQKKYGSDRIRIRIRIRNTEKKAKNHRIWKKRLFFLDFKNFASVHPYMSKTFI